MVSHDANRLADVSLKVKVSRTTSDQPRWSSDGKQLFYIGKDHDVMSATLHVTGTEMEVAETRTLFKLDIPNFEVSGDGKRLLIFKIAENQEPSSVTLISHWTNALPR